MENPFTLVLSSDPEAPFDVQFAQKHLTILRRFQSILKVVEASKCPVEEFLVVAEARYATYLNIISDPAHEYVQILPPWDVAIVAYAHHLSPKIFLRDTQRIFSQEDVDKSIHFPTDGLAMLIEKDVWSDAESERIWTQRTPDYPYQLWRSSPRADVVAPPALPMVSIRCPYTNCKASISMDSHEWSEVRMASGYHYCPGCRREVLRRKICLANLLHDCNIWASTPLGQPCKPLKASRPRLEISISSHVHKLDETFRKWSTDICNTAVIDMDTHTVENATDLLGARHSDYDKSRLSINNAYESNPWPNFSIDLLDAVLQLRLFIDTFTGQDWYCQSSTDIGLALKRYTKFMRVLRKVAYRPEGGVFYDLAPTSDIAFCWVVHLQCQNYFPWCVRTVGRIVDFTVTRSLFEERGPVDMMKDLWMKEFGESYEDHHAHVNELTIGFLRHDDDTTASECGTPLKYTMADARDLEPEGQSVSPYEKLLGKSAFRLLWFRHVNEDGVLYFELQEFDIYQGPKYRAVSYVWSLPWANVEDSDDEMGGQGRSDQDDDDQSTNDEERSDSEDVSQSIVYCNGHPVSVSANGLALLKQLSTAMAPSYIWMDAICINQDDLEERSQQVAIMHEIYSTAVQVIGWLGPDHEYLDDFRWASSTFKLCVEYHHRPVKFFEDLRRPDDYPPLVDHLFWQRIWLDKTSSIARLQRAAFFSGICEWFNRSWIAQEVILSKSIFLLCGSTWLSWDGIVTLGVLFTNDWAEIVQGSHIPGMPDVFSMGSRGMGFRARQFHLVRERLQHGKAFDTYGESCATPKTRNLVSTVSLLHQNRNMDCTDDRDKIYSVLGMVEMISKKEGTFTEPMIRVDYGPDQSASILYRDFTKLALEHLDSLTVLSFVEHGTNNLEDLPSWVPDFSFGFGASPIISFSPSGRLFDVWAGNSLTGRKVITRNDQLLLRGIKLGTVVATADTVGPKGPVTLANLWICTPNLKRPEKMSVVEYLMWTMLMRDPDDPPPGTTVESLKQCLYNWFLMKFHEEITIMERNVNHWLLNPIKEGSIVASDDTPLTVQEIWEGLRTTVDKFQAEVKDNELPSFETCSKYVELDRKWFTAVNNHSNEEPDLGIWQDLYASSHMFNELVGQHLRWRGVFAMEDEDNMRHLGISAIDVELGDEVWILNGGRVTYNLRPREGRPGVYKFCSDSYVQGVMHGEYFKENPGITLEDLDTIILE